MRLVYVFIIISNIIFCQNTIEGNLKDKYNNVVVGSSVTITDKDTGKIIGYAISDEIGKYKIVFTSSLKTIELKVMFIGYKTITETLLNKTQTKNYTLEEQSFELKEVIVKSEKISVFGDTINYNVNSFSNKEDRSIGDVLKRMPGIEIKNDGTILYQGTPINKYYIEGLDLLEGKYNLANENLPHGEVLKVQILENHQPIKILDTLEFSNKAALNIRLKKNNIFTGQAELGSGFSPLLWDVNITPMLFSKKNQMLFSYQTNNTGSDAASQVKSLTTDDISERFENNDSKTDWLSIQKLQAPDFSDQRWLDNNVHLMSVNILTKLKKDYELRFNSSYLNNYQQEDGFSQTLFFTASDTISLFESKYNQFYTNSIDADLTLQKNTKKSYLTNNTKFKGYWDGQNGIIDNNITEIRQKLSNRFFSFSNQFYTIFPLGKKLITINSNLSFNRTPQSLTVSPGQFENILNEDENFNEVTQEINLKSFYSNTFLGFTKGLGYFTFTNKIGLQIEVQDLLSSINIDNERDLGSEFFNNLNWLRNKAYFILNTQFRKGDWQIGLETPIAFNSYKIDDENLIQSQMLNRTTFEPLLTVNYNINLFWKLTASSGLTNSFGTIDKLHYAYILNNYRNLQRINSVLPENLNKKFGVGLYYRNPVKSLFVNFQYNYINKKNNLLYENEILTDGSLEINARENENFRLTHILSGNASKYFNDLNSSLSINSNYFSQSYNLSLNNLPADIINNNLRLGSKIVTNIKSFLSLEYSNTYLISYSTIQNQEKQKTIQHASNLKMNLNLYKKHYFGINNEYIRNSLFSENNLNFFSDIIYRYTLDKKKIDFEVQWLNILNTKNYRTILVNDYNYIETNYRLRPTQLLFKIRFTL